MPKILLPLFIFFSTFISHAQIDTSSVSFVAYWSIGDSYDYKVTKTTQKWKNGELVTDTKQETLSNFTVIDSTEKTYSIKWSYDTNLEGNYNIPKNFIEKLSKYENTVVLYNTNELGAFLEVINWEEIRDVMTSMIDDVVLVLSENGSEKNKKLINVMKPFKEIYQTKEGIEQLVVKDLQLFHMPMGLEFDTKETINYEDEITNFLGGRPIKTDAKIYFTEVDNENSFCTFKHDMNLNPNDTQDILLQVFKRMKLKNKATKKALKNAVFEISDNNIYEYYYYPCVPHKIEASRTSLINIFNSKSKKIDKTIIELIYDTE